jgi:hypothetical protein
VLAILLLIKSLEVYFQTFSFLCGDGFISRFTIQSNIRRKPFTVNKIIEDKGGWAAAKNQIVRLFPMGYNINVFLYCSWCEKYQI